MWNFGGVCQEILPEFARPWDTNLMTAMDCSGYMAAMDCNRLQWLESHDRNGVQWTAMAT